MNNFNYEICIINPYKNYLLADKIILSARKVSSSKTKIIISKHEFDNSIDHEYYDESVNVTNLIKEIENNDTSDAFIISCFEDPAIEIARSIKSKLIIGIGEASFYTANLIAKNFSIITTLSRSNEAIKNNLVNYGLDHKCVSINAIEVPVLDLETMSKINLSKLKNEIKRTIEEDKAESIILCTPGMFNITKQLEEEFQIPIIEGVSAAITMVESLLKLNFRINKLGSNNLLKNTKYNGYFSEFLKHK